ncbi:MAG: hypothetical protein AAF851_12455 [Myxococcota bacterium]
MSEPTRDEFFVGYLPTPPGVRRFALRIAYLALALVIGAATALAFSHRRAGPASWDISLVVELEGVLQTEPYGVLHLEEGSALLVEATKFGLRPEASALEGRRVTLRGTLLQRDGDRMLALLPGDDAFTDLGEDELPDASALGKVQLTGNIVDSKCFLGAMKPGDGAGHRPCAQLCIRGGIPPVLISDDPEHPKVIVVDEEGRPMTEKVLPLVAEELTLSGQLFSQGDRKFFRISLP